MNLSKISNKELYREIEDAELKMYCSSSEDPEYKRIIDRQENLNSELTSRGLSWEDLLRIAATNDQLLDKESQAKQEYGLCDGGGSAYEEACFDMMHLCKRILTERGYFKEKEESYQREYNQTIEREFNTIMKLGDDEFKELSAEIKNTILNIEYSDNYDNRNKERKANAARIDAFRSAETIKNHINPIIESTKLSNEEIIKEIETSKSSPNWKTHSAFVKDKIGAILAKKNIKPL